MTKMKIQTFQQPAYFSTAQRRKTFRQWPDKQADFSWKKLLWILLAPLGFGLQQLLTNFPNVIESIYIPYFYRTVVRTWSLITGFLPFSLIEILLILLAVAVPVFLFFHIRKTVQARKNHRLSTFFRPLSTLSIVIAIWYFMTVLLWNITYSRSPLPVLTGLKTASVDAKMLQSVCFWLADEANILRKTVQEDQSGVMMLSTDIPTTLKDASLGYDALSDRFSFFEGNYGPPKPVLLSKMMSATRIIGIYTVTTAEANVDIDIPQAEIPFTALHEMAHQRGIAREDDANASAWFAAMVHPRNDFRYSGALNAYIYASNALYGADKDKWQEVVATLSAGVNRDLQAQKTYWKQFDSFVDKAAEKMNDGWLKSNGQSDGVKSYGRMVDLIVAEFQRQNK